MRRWAAPLCLVVAVVPAAAQTMDVDMPAAPLTVVVERLSRRFGISVVLTDPKLLTRRVPVTFGAGSLYSLGGAPLSFTDTQAVRFD
ncbi:hypothetical protein ASG29_08010 [Sphingomonas sp. Leaf412]|uniref:hypothetical protein n=1 Tax=Sphingomonas sp. Leaf412 TaxID=1736370 RepID=UPI0006F84A67|nr:hypothetical protein [Sphingomonas sp. Leaf412]KQT31837.1 hypothetical protein ASG29_08010 [Sphingomonas sp. Leaf412]